MPELTYIKEPHLLFNYDQPMLDPRDGLSLFGPLDRAKPEGIRWAVIGPKDSISRMKRWIERIQRPVISGSNLTKRPLFPGFEAAFNTRWNPIPVLEIEVPEQELWQHAHNSDKYQRVYRTVDMYSKRIIDAFRTENVTVDVWCVVIPEYIYQNCRPKSTIAANLKVQSNVTMSLKMARSFSEQPSLFPVFNKLAEQYLYEVNFHHQLKARLFKQQVPTQVVREIKIAYQEFIDSHGHLKYHLEKLEKQESAIAWNLSTAIFYKAGGRP